MVTSKSKKVEEEAPFLEKEHEGPVGVSPLSIDPSPPIRRDKALTDISVHSHYKVFSSQ